MNWHISNGFIFDAVIRINIESRIPSLGHGSMYIRLNLAPHIMPKKMVVASSPPRMPFLQTTGITGAVSLPVLLKWTRDPIILKDCSIHNAIRGQAIMAATGMNRRDVTAISTVKTVIAIVAKSNFGHWYWSGSSPFARRRPLTEGLKNLATIQEATTTQPIMNITRNAVS